MFDKLKETARVLFYTREPPAAFDITLSRSTGRGIRGDTGDLRIR